MHDPLLVRILERLGDLDRNCQRLDDGERAALQSLEKRFALDELHDQEMRGRCAADLFHAVERGDVRMIERRKHLGFALEARYAIGISGKGFG